ncbi:MAG: LytTR family DNA-binding domain-containing protein [Pseudomonadota bacterium]
MTLREMKDRFLAPHMLAIWVAAAGGATLAGPFGTYDLPILARSIYWLCAVGLAMVLSGLIISAAYDMPRLERLPAMARGIVGALVFSALYSILLVGFGGAFFSGDGFPSFPLMFAYVTPICISITVAIHLFHANQPAQVVAATGPPPFLKRLKPALGTKLIRLSMQDHYVEAVTDQGSQLVLMRFADALAEVDGIPGWRIHRSHWVAEAGLSGLKREAGKTIIITADAAELPVSRTYLPRLRDAGVIRRLS